MLDFIKVKRFSVILFTLFISTFSNASIITGNLLLNPGAEDGFEHWTNGGQFGFTSRQAAVNRGGVLDQTEGESWFFGGGTAGLGVGFFFQDVDVSGFDFSEGITSAVYGGDAFGSSTRRPAALSTNNVYRLFFLDELGATISTIAYSVNNGQGSPEFALDTRRSGIVPTGTETIRFRATGGDGTNSSVALGFDDLHLSLENAVAVPEPGVLMTLCLGLGLLFTSKRTQNKFKYRRS